MVWSFLCFSCFWYIAYLGYRAHPHFLVVGGFPYGRADGTIFQPSTIFQHARKNWGYNSSLTSLRLAGQVLDL